MFPEIEQLITLQHADAEIRRLHAEIAELPKRVAVIEEKLAGTKASLEKANAWTKAGLMAREDLTGGSRNVFVLATPDVNGFRMSSRFSPGGSTLVTGTTGSVSYPNTWLRLKRVGTSITAFFGTDGVTWTTAGTINLTSLATTGNLGFTVAGGTAQVTARFDNTAG